jgi:hypothetical protein
VGVGHGIPARVIAVAIVAYALARGLILLGVVPPWQGPDEPGHALYALLLARGVPVPAEGDAPLETAMLASMARHDFYDHLGIQEPDPPPRRLAEVERLGGDPTQLVSETPVGYLPYACAAAATGTVGPPEPGTLDAALGRMRLVSLALVLATLGAAAWAAASALGPRLGVATVALVAATPVLGFAGAVVNNDLPATVLAAVWFGLVARTARRGRGHGRLAALVVLVATTVLAVLAKRTALYLLPSMALVAPLLWRASRGSSLEVPRHKRRTRPIGVLGAVGVMLSAAAIATVAGWPLADQADGWTRVGPSWGAERSAGAARTGGAGLVIADRSATAWQYAEQSVTLAPGAAATGAAVSGSTWLRSDVAGTRAHLVVNDDRGTWLSRVVVLGPEWQPVAVSGHLAAGARWVRLAIVPGAGDVAGTGLIAADDAVLTVDGLPRLVNGGAETPRRLGTVLLRAATAYADLGRIAASLPHGLAQPGNVVVAGARALEFTVRSFWGGFGWLTIWPGPLHYRLAVGLALFVALAHAIALVAPGRLRSDPTAASLLRASAGMAVLAVGISAVGSMAGWGPGHLPQGRYLLAALVPLALPPVALSERLRSGTGPWILVLAAVLLDVWANVSYIWVGFR